MTPTLSSARPPARARRADAEHNRTAILEAAAVALNRDPDASLQSIAAEAHLTRRALYGHFSTREDLIIALLWRGASRITLSITAVDCGNSRMSIARIGSRLWGEVEHVRVMARFAVRGPFAPIVAEALAPLRRLLLTIVKRGIAAGELRQDISPELLSRLIEGSALAVLDEANRTPLGRDDGARLVMQAGLAMAGLSWRESEQTITEMDRTP
ncbi:TetR family transcriptional regulator [Glaciihabitans tibetensis]|uniref:TetR family transcriptional regulator n=1 Tax=Glaciihabitans tibetensis TaxID=1266600 RepID=A0A2T0VD35_9MICO|nr:TetR/AcrR family transcriptional regulator [Glaciihabitans tibetensis]PRY68092.1 TetR family transcriptional regulator [Glaciihabitans tibetensis]